MEKFLHSTHNKEYTHNSYCLGPFLVMLRIYIINRIKPIKAPFWPLSKCSQASCRPEAGLKFGVTGLLLWNLSLSYHNRDL